MTSTQALTFKQLNPSILGGIVEIRMIATGIIDGRYDELTPSECSDLRPAAALLHSDEYYRWADGGALSQAVLQSIARIGKLELGTSLSANASAWAEASLDGCEP